MNEQKEHIFEDVELLIEVPVDPLKEEQPKENIGLLIESQSDCV